MKQFLIKTLNRTAIYYSALVLIFSMLILISNPDTESLSLDPSRIIWMFPFCICFAVANVTFKHTDMGSIGKWLIHFSLTVIGAFIFIILPADLTESSSRFMGLVIITAMYLLCVIIYAIFSVRLRKTLNEDKQLKNRK